MLPKLVNRARRRLIWNDLLAQGANALCAGFVAFILLLLAGTQVLEWYWAALIPLAAIGYGLFRTWRHAPDGYAAAQVLDRELLLADTLSTAIFFNSNTGTRRADEGVRQFQYAAAERLAAPADVRRAVPFRMPRAVYAVAALFLVASSLFALRYGLSHRLDLRPPLASILRQTMGGDERTEDASARKKNAPKPPAALDEKGFSLSDQEKSNELDAFRNATETIQIPDLETKSMPGEQARNEQADRIAGDGEDSDSDGSNPAAGDGTGEGKQGGNESKEGQKSASNPQQGQDNDKSGLMQKLKEAMQNLLAKMKIPPSGEQRKQGSQTAQKGKQGKQQGEGKQSGQGQKQQGAGQESEAQEGRQGEQAETAQSNQTKGGGQDQEKPANKQPGSGIGKNDGEKDLKLAEQMAAMGKLSQIIGKRSANVSGEAMVEVQNTNQQLTTRYESRKASHGGSGGEISRDEVPVDLQGYVAAYFEQVRKAEVKSQK